MKLATKYNRVVYGLIPGLIIPLLTFFGFYLFKSGTKNPVEYVEFILEMGMLSNILSLCVIPNLLVFFFFLNKNFYYGARGVLFATFFYVVVVVVARYFL